MQNKPQSWELLETIQSLLIKEILPQIKDNDLLAYKTLVSWNMLGVVSREIQTGEELLDKELISLASLLNETIPDQTLSHKLKTIRTLLLNHTLTNKIKQDKIADIQSETWKHVKTSLQYKLQVSNPRFSLD